MSNNKVYLIYQDHGASYSYCHLKSLADVKKHIMCTYRGTLPKVFEISDTLVNASIHDQITKGKRITNLAVNIQVVEI